MMITIESFFDCWISMVALTWQMAFRSFKQHLRLMRFINSTPKKDRLRLNPLQLMLMVIILTPKFLVPALAAVGEGCFRNSCRKQIQHAWFKKMKLR
jgi:hypothetical protein